jgi:hypothetical protein
MLTFALEAVFLEGASHLLPCYLSQSLLKILVLEGFSCVIILVMHVHLVAF